MARIALDFSKVESSNFPVFPTGSYTLLIKEARQEAAKSSGELKLSVQFEIVDGPNGSPEFAGKKVFSSYSLKPAAAFRVKKLCVAAGMSNEEIDAGVDDELLISRQIRADLAVEKYNNRDVNRVQNEAPSSASPSANGVNGSSFAPLPEGFSVPSLSGVPTTFGAPTLDAPAPPPAKID